VLTAPLGAWAISYYGNRILEVGPLEVLKQQKDRSITKEDVLNSFTVSNIMEKDIIIVKENEKISKVFEYFSNYDFLVYPVVGTGNRLAGIIRLGDLRTILQEHHSWELILAKDAAVSITQRIYVLSSLNEALGIMKEGGLEQMPVVEENSEKVVGLLDAHKAEKFVEQRFLEMTRKCI